MKPFDFLPGEEPITQAPSVVLDDGRACVPQHYLRYTHSLASAEAVVARIAYDENYPIFVSEDAGGIFIQIGVIGPDNYKADKRNKIVFGRRWRVEPNLPTSEIIQTVFLALKKAREHEIREQVRLHFDGHVATPFSCHQDLPLLARQNPKARPCAQTPAQIVSKLRYGSAQFKLIDTVNLRGGDIVLTVQTQSPHSDLKDIISFTSPSGAQAAILHNFMDTLVRLSDRDVEERFTFDGFARFSHTVCPEQIARFSIMTRQCPTKLLADDAAARFISEFSEQNYEIDSTRIPTLSDSEYGQAMKTKLSALGVPI